MRQNKADGSPASGVDGMPAGGENASTGRSASAKPGRVTSYEVAKAAGVSQSAVSRTFSRNGYVSPATRERVLAAAGRLGFSPNALARSLITRRSRLIGVVIAELRYSFHVTLLHQLCAAVRDAGFQTLLVSVPDSANLDASVQSVIDYQVDGVIIASVRLSSRSSQLCERANIPLVLINRHVADRGFHAIGADNEEAGRLAARRLLSADHRRFAFIAGIPDTSTSIDRERGFLETVFASGLPNPAVRTGHFTYDGGHSAALDLMADTDRPDAIFCASDIMAIGAMDAIRRDLGLRVPDDVSVIGFNDADVASWKSYALTTFAVDVGMMCRRAVDLLAGLVDDPDQQPLQETVSVSLVERQSVRPPVTPEPDEPVDPA